jgi:GNAT superfamily N-acetyltransferase
MPPTLRKAYWHDLAARRTFQQFILDIHGLDFARWEQAGYWDEDYSPWSYFDGERLAASLCIYTMPAVIGGQACHVAQVSGVGTAPEHRLRGLNRQLHEMALAEALRQHRFAFLYADEEAVPFYRKCGFRPVDNHAVVVPLPEAAPQDGLVKLDMDDPAQRDAVYCLAQARTPASHEFSTHNPKLVMFHALYPLRHHVFRVPALNCVVMMKREPGRTVVYDLLAETLPSFDALAPYLGGRHTREVEFRFAPDRLGAPSGERVPLPGDNVHVMGDFPLGERPVFPATSQA